jgi:hypothetical protein
VTGSAPQSDGAVSPHRPFPGAGRRLLLFAVAALCFLLPFGTVSCGGEKVEVTGFQLVTRSVPNAGVDDEFGQPNLAQEVEDAAFVHALIALAAVLVGFALAGWAPTAIGRAFLVSLGAIIALLSLPVRAGAELVDFTLGPGFVFALAAELWLAGDLLHALVRRRWPRKQRSARTSRRRSHLPPGAVPWDTDET